MYSKGTTLTQTYELKLTTRADGSLTLPARGYSWPPFEDGNTPALVHCVSQSMRIAIDLGKTTDGR
jgi:hypothetical protein